MLWLDDDRKLSLEEKVLRAAAYYKDKYGRLPDLCLVNRGSATEQTVVGQIEIRPAANVLPHHFLVGMKAN